MLILGLTGSIATGKSTVTGRLQSYHKLRVVDADVIARQVVEPDTRAYKAIVQYFSDLTPDLLNEDKSLNRAALGSTVFGNEKHRKVLNGIVHPAVRRAMLWQVLQSWFRGDAMVVLDVPLLFESKLDRFCGITLAVLCDQDVQYTRLRERNKELSEADARARIASQMSLDEKRRRSDLVIENDGSIEDLHFLVDKVVYKVKPSFLRTLLQWIPPVGLACAGFCYLT